MGEFSEFAEALLDQISVEINEEQEIAQGEIVDDRVSTITPLLLDSMGESLLAGTENGDLLYWDMRNVEEPRLMGIQLCVNF